MKKDSINVQGTSIILYEGNHGDFISITDIARHRDSERSDYILQNWMRNKSTIEFIGLWELFNNPDFNSIEFDGIKNMAGSNSFALTPKRWIEATNAIGIVSKTGRYGGTFAHKDIAFEFASWLSAEFKFYLIREFQRLKEEEQKALGWSAKRELAKINYHIHTDAIKHNLIPAELTPQQTSIIYANEADVLNVALFGVTAKEWREANPDLKGNIRDYAAINELICLSNMENLNAIFINEGLPQLKRLIKLNQIAIQQMKVLQEVEGRKLLK
ncbi:MAG: KilA-N domain-containing protein [Leptospirales bacterium]|nr:KilA-N domain-containing protein [Leptospirales bacterium]